MQLIINLIPVAVIFVILILKKHMLFAGLVGAVLAMIIGRIGIADAGTTVVEGIGTLFSAMAPILYAATAAMTAKGGCFKSVVVGTERLLRGKFAVLAALLVVVQSFATYMAGMSAGNTMVIAPLIAVAVGAVPEVIAGLAIASAACFITSPASTQAVVTAENIGMEVSAFSTTMLPLTIVFIVLGAALAFIGVHKRGRIINEAEDDDETADVPTYKLFIQAIPAIALLILVVFGNNINKLIGVHVIVPAFTVCIVAVLTVLLTPLNIEKTCDALVDGSKFILTTLFSVGIFLGFINIIAMTGIFEQLAGLVGMAPQAIIVPVAMILAFLIAIPSGAFCAGVLTLILPTLSLLGLSPIAMGFIALATGFGTQVSPVQINIAALSDGFNKDIMWVVKSNMKYMLGALVFSIILSFFFI